MEIEYIPNESGIFRGKILVRCSGSTTVDSIELSATSIDYFVFLVDPEGLQIQVIDFGLMYFGDSKKKQCALVNNSPEPFKFKAQFEVSFEEEEEK